MRDPGGARGLPGTLGCRVCGCERPKGLPSRSSRGGMPRGGGGGGCEQGASHFCKTLRGSRRSLGDSGENLMVPVTHSCNFHVGSVCLPRPGNTEVAFATHPPTRHRVLQNHVAPALPALSPRPMWLPAVTTTPGSWHPEDLLTARPWLVPPPTRIDSPPRTAQTPVWFPFACNTKSPSQTRDSRPGETPRLSPDHIPCPKGP